MTPLAKTNLGGLAGCLIAAVLVARDYPIDAAESAWHTHLAEVFVIVAMFFWLGFCFTFKSPDK